MQKSCRLAELPSVPAGNLPLKVLEKLLDFQANVQKQFDGGSAKFVLPKQCYNLAEEFRQLLEHNRPRLVVTEPRNANHVGSIDNVSQTTPTPVRRINYAVPEAIEIDSASEGETALKPIRTLQDKKRVNGDSSQETPIKRQRMSEIPFYTPSIKRRSMFQVAPRVG